MLPSDNAKLDDSCMEKNITNTRAKRCEKGFEKVMKKTHKVKDSQFSLKWLRSLQQRGFKGGMADEGADPSTERNQDACRGISTCKEMEARNSKTH